MLLKIIKSLCKQISQKKKFDLFLKKWAVINSHNSTYPTNYLPIEKISVGKRTYGPINVEYYGNEKENLRIGNYVSIAPNVIFILGGNHQIDTISSFPLFSKLIDLDPTKDALSKGEIVVEDEVWIGYGATILSGVTIGKGAIIGAKSVVTTNIPEYAIVAGNPAKIIRFKFDEKIRELLRNFYLKDINEELIIENIDEFYKSLDVSQIEILKEIAFAKSKI